MAAVTESMGLIAIIIAAATAVALLEGDAF